MIKRDAYTIKKKVSVHSLPYVNIECLSIRERCKHFRIYGLDKFGRISTHATAPIDNIELAFDYFFGSCNCALIAFDDKGAMVGVIGIVRGDINGLGYETVKQHYKNRSKKKRYGRRRN